MARSVKIYVLYQLGGTNLKWQPWRMVTTFFYFGTISLDFVFHLFFLCVFQQFWLSVYAKLTLSLSIQHAIQPYAWRIVFREQEGRLFLASPSVIRHAPSTLLTFHTHFFFVLWCIYMTCSASLLSSICPSSPRHLLLSQSMSGQDGIPQRRYPYLV